MKTLHFQNIVRDMLGTNDLEGAKEKFPIKVELDAEKKIQAEAFKNRIRVKEFFHDFDKLRKGVVSEAGFKTALATLNIPLSEFEIGQLLDKYRTPEGLVNYRSFVEQIEKVFYEEKEAQDALDKHRSKPNLTAEEAGILFSTMEEMRKIVKDHSILMKPHFAAFDTTKRSHITVGQFSRVLKQLNLLPEDKAFDVLARAYADNNTLHDVNYVKFIIDIDSPFKAAMNEVVKNTPEYFTKMTVTTIDHDEFKKMDTLKPRFMEPTIDLQSHPDDVEEKIRATVVMKRVRVSEFFLDFDKLRKGFVTKQQFSRILSMLGFHLTESEYQALENKYKNEDGHMNYVEFCNNIDSVFTIKGIEKIPTATVKQLSTEDSLKARRKRLEMDEESMNKLYEALKIASKLALTQRFNMKPFFQAFDTTACGYVTKSQFTRVLFQVGLKPKEEILNIILKYYMNRGNVEEVNYVDFVNDVDKPEDIYLIEEKDFSMDTVKKIAKLREDKINAKLQIINRKPEDVEDVLALIRIKVKQERIRLAEFMKDFDKLRSGNITESQFRIGLNMGKFHLSNDEFDNLCQHFASEVPGKVRWRDFVDRVEEVFTLKGLEQKPTLSVEEAKTETKYGKLTPDTKDAELCAQIVEKFGLFLTRENLDIKSFFQEWDRHRHFKVSPKQFRQVLASNKFSMTDDEFKAVVAHYQEHGTGDILYLNFLQDAAPWKYPKTKPKGMLTVDDLVGVSGKTQEEIDNIRSVLHNIMTKVKNVTMQKRIRIEEFFLDHDPLRKGDVTEEKFKGCLDILKLELTDSEYNILVSQMRSERDPERIDYVKFREEVNKIFTEKDLEKNPTKKLETYNIQSVLDPDDLLNTAEEERLVAILQRLGEIVNKRKLHIKPMFQDKDISKSGVVMDTRFRAILDFYKISISDAEYALLKKRFVSKAKNEINYVEFDKLLRYYSGDWEASS